jgi:hypothetical protein
VGTLGAWVEEFGIMLCSESFGPEAGFFLLGFSRVRRLLSEVCRLLTVLRICSGVGGFAGRFPE